MTSTNDYNPDYYSPGSFDFTDTAGNANYIYAITFEGEVHDSPLVSLGPGKGNWDTLKIGTPSAQTPTFAEEYAGNGGTTETSPSIAMTADGSFIEVWNQYSSDGSNDLYFRGFDESTNTAGPLVTEVTEPNGQRITGPTTVTATNGQQTTSTTTLTEQTPYLVVSFDENMDTTGGSTGANSVLNPSNWSLVKNGTARSGGISKIDFGMNEANTLFGAPADNRYEAVLF